MKLWKYILITLTFWLCLQVQNTNAYTNPSASLFSEAGILYHRETKTIVWEKNSRQKMYPASLTKLMTADVILHSDLSMQETVTISSKMLAGLEEANASVAGFVAQETVTVKDLLYGLLLPSGGDAANALSQLVSNDEHSFVKLMNERTKSLGLADTNFQNPTGLDQANQYTTAYDMMLLLDHLLEHEEFRTIATTSKYTVITNKHPQGLEMQSSMVVGTDPKSRYYSPYMAGGKTGYTGKAGRCLASFSSDQGMEFIHISLKAPFEGFTAPSKSFADAKELYTWAYDRFYPTVYADSKQPITAITIPNAWHHQLRVAWDKPVTVLLDRYFEDNVMMVHTIPETLSAPIAKGQKLGSVQLYYQNLLIHEQEMYSPEAIKSSIIAQAVWYLYDFIAAYPFALAAVSIILMILLIRRYHIAAQRRKKMKRRKYRQTQYIKRQF